MIGFTSGVDKILTRVQAALPAGIQAYLVGGCLRDALLSRPTNDLDLALAGDVFASARRVANELGAAYYPLDETRGAARLVLTRPDGSRMKLDFSVLRGPDLESDLRARDFTINAMALPLGESSSLIDPLGGVADLRARRLRACSETAFTDDPVRVVRSIRLAVSLDFKIQPETSHKIRQAVPLLANVSPERVRDELFRMLEGPKAGTAIRLLDILGALGAILPEVVALKGVAQSAPHIGDVWGHTLDMLQKLDLVLETLSIHYDQEKAASWALGFISIQLGRYRQMLAEHLDGPLNPERSLRALLFLACLYHDAGKPSTQHADAMGRIRFYDHEQVGSALVVQRARALRLSNAEIDRLSTIVQHHMRPLLLAQAGTQPSRRAIYRYFQATGPAGIDIGVLSLADTLAIYGPTVARETWAGQLDVIRALYAAWWEHPEQSVTPPLLVNGNDLMRVFSLEAGPQIGKLLDAIREAQAAGLVNTREQAFDLARRQIYG